MPTLSPIPLLTRLRAVAAAWMRHQHELVVLAAELADGPEWLLDGSPTPAHWLAAVADVEACTAREWIRIGKLLRILPASADAFEQGRISYSKVRTLSRLANPGNEADLLAIAERTPAGELGRALAAWLTGTHNADEVAAHQHRRRSVCWRNDPDGTVSFTARLEPLVAGRLMAALTARVMRSTPKRDPVGWPTVAQQYADALDDLLRHGSGKVITELVIHLRGDGATLDDGTPVPASVVEGIAPESFLRTMTHDAARRPINASGRHRHPTVRQRRVVKERDRICVDCGRAELLQFDHVPDFEITRRTIVDELELRCAPCHRARHST